MPDSLLSPAEIDTALKTLDHWKVEDGELVFSLALPDFRAALALVNRVGELAEAADHHPDIDIRYNKVMLALSSHDAGGITDKDFSLAAAIGHVL